MRLIKDGKFDVIFCDPPYKSGYGEIALGLALKYDILKPGGVIIIEHSSENDLINIPENCIIDKRIFGATALSFVSRGGDDGSVCGDV